MRSTLTLDPDVSRLLQERMKRENLSYKQVVNDAIREGFIVREPRKATYNPLTFSLGKPLVDLTKANALAAEFEDQEIKEKYIRAANEKLAKRTRLKSAKK